jgi:DNA-binding MarR family transcriptional regulator
LTTSGPEYPLGPPLIGALLRLPWEALRDRMLAGLHEAGFDDLSPAHFNILQYPGPENRRPSELVAETKMTKQAINYLLAQLEQLGYLTRENDPEDQRSKRIHLTERGHAAARTIREIVREVEADWERKLGTKRFAELRELLIQLQSHRAKCGERARSPKTRGTPP